MSGKFLRPIRSLLGTLTTAVTAPAAAGVGLRMWWGFLSRVVVYLEGGDTAGWGY